MTAHPAKRTGFVVALAVLSIAQFVAVAHGAPVPNLVLTCSDENAIGQEQSACHGIWAYQIQADPLIVSSGSLAEWSVFGELIGADTVYVCTLPVEPGQYSSCRDASGVRRMALVRKDSLIAGGTGGSVTVDKIGGDYTDPVTAAANAFAGDTWCVAPQWPGQPCVMAIGDGVFILNETLRIPEGLVVAGLGKGATMLVADNGVETAVSTFGRVRVSDLTIVNSQPGGARTTGIDANGPNARTAPLAQLHDVAVHVAGGAQNVAVVKAASLEILDSTITAVGQDAIGIALGTTPPVGGTRTTLERSHISATTALDDHVVHVGQVILTDSHVFGEVVFGYDGSLLEITRSEVTGSVSANGRGVRIVITGSSIKGEVCACGGSASTMEVTDTSIEGGVRADHAFNPFIFDGLQLHGELHLEATGAHILRSYINSPSTAAAVSLWDADVKLETTFLQGALALAADTSTRLESSSSVLASPVSASGSATLSCTDTYGADYELLTASCQPQPPP